MRVLQQDARTLLEKDVADVIRFLIISFATSPSPISHVLRLLSERDRLLKCGVFGVLLEPSVGEPFCFAQRAFCAARIFASPLALNFACRAAWFRHSLRTLQRKRQALH